MNIVDMILPKSKIKPYVNLVCNSILVFRIMSPIVGICSTNSSLEDTILKKITDYTMVYVDSYNDLAKKTKNEELAKG